MQYYNLQYTIRIYDVSTQVIVERSALGLWLQLSRRQYIYAFSAADADNVIWVLTVTGRVCVATPPAVSHAPSTSLPRTQRLNMTWHDRGWAVLKIYNSICNAIYWYLLAGRYFYLLCSSHSSILDTLERSKIQKFCQVQILYISNIPYLLASVDEEI